MAGYGSYYRPGSSQSGQHIYGFSASARSSSTYPDSPSYQNGASQFQYSGEGYGWTGQPQQGYSHNQEQNQASGGVGGMANQATPHHYQQHYRKDAPRYIAPSSDSNHVGLTSTSHHLQAPGNLGLNSLAYASGLESSGMNTSENSNAYQNGPGNPHNYAPTRNIGAHRPVSPDENTSRAYPAATQSYNAQYSTLSVSNQRLASSAAAALAGAVSRRQQTTQSSTAHKPASPTPEFAVFRYRPQNRQPSIDQIGLDPKHRTSTQAHSHQRSITTAPQTRPPTSSAPSLGRSTQPPQEAPVVADGSIASLISTDQDQPSHMNRIPMQLESIPAFIDPSQVFNPYHREHERRLREAAEAEVKEKLRLAAVAEAEEKRRQSAEAEAEERRKAIEAEAEVNRREAAEAPAPTPTPTGSVAIPNKPRKGPIAKSAPDKSGNATEPFNRPCLDGQEDAKSPDAENMATEMKHVLEKMRALKDKDPNLFQKLWEGMKQTVPTDSAGNAAVASLTPAPMTTPVAQTSLVPMTMTLGNPDLQSTELRKPKPHRATGGALSGHAGYSAPANGYQIVIENNKDGLPDLGRFPAERRIRASYKKDKTESNGRLVQLDGESAQAPTQHYPGDRIGPVSQATIASNTVPQPLPSKSVAGTVWPEAKRNALAAAAVEALSSEPENQRIGVRAADIHVLLEQNPSYLDLCTMLEARGLKFQRGAFARHLLKKVPDLSGHSIQQAREAQVARAALPTPVKVAPGLPLSSTSSATTVMPPAPQVHFTNPYNPQTPHRWPPAYPVRAGPQPPITIGHIPPTAYGAPPGPPMGYFPGPGNRVIPIPKPQQPANRPMARPTQPLAVPEPPPGSKEAAARKRDFSELVDLTALSDSEDYVMPSKQARLEPPAETRTDPSHAYNGRLAPPTAHVPSQSYQALQSSGLSLLPSSMSTVGYGQTAELQSAQIPPKKAKTLLAKTINKKEALRKSYYDPKTVARDILIATGRHPTERPLNAHLAGLLEKYVDLDSDLTTFDWDAVDPSGPSPPQVELVDIPAGSPKWKLGERKGTTQGSRDLGWSERIAQGPTQKRPDDTFDVAKSNDAKQGTLHPPPALFSRFAAQSRQLLKNSSKAAKDSLDIAKGSSQIPSRLRESRLAPDDTENQLVSTVTSQKRRASSRPSLTSPPPPAHNNTRSRTEPSSNPNPLSSKPMDTPRRRGRPSGSRNKTATIGHTKKAPQPVVSIPAAPSVTESFTVYKCRWKNCGAHLHNLPTLRRHIVKVHGKSAIDEGYICWWRKCLYLKREANDETFRPEKIFELQSDWLDHIEETHLHPIGLKYGDGPSSTPTGKLEPTFDVSKYRFTTPDLLPSSARTLSYADPQTLARDRTKYLSDADNRTTTPSAVSAEKSDVPADTMELAKATKDPKDLVALKAYMKAHGNKKMDVRKSAEETLRAMKVRKEKIGPGLDRGGCILVTESRRTTLVQDADMARVIEFDYE